MASVHHLCIDAHFIGQHILAQHHALSETVKNAYFSVVIIQRTWRGYAVRKMIKRWHLAATIIQKWVRGWLWRWHLPEFYQDYLDWAIMKKYNEMATKIQAWWRGYLTRKNIGDIKTIREGRHQLEEKNREMQHQMQDAFEKMKREKEEREAEECKESVLFVLFKLHHLLRTSAVEGIYSKHGKRGLSFVETLLKALHFKSYMTALRQEYNKHYRELEELKKNKPYMFEPVNLRNLEDAYRKRDTSKDVKEVTRTCKSCARHKKPFVFRRFIEEKPYQRMMFSAEEYVGKPKTFMLRSFDKSKNICGKDFDLRVCELAIVEPKEPPYYMDMWNKSCVIHDIIDN